jgi:hypothetical protein
VRQVKQFGRLGGAAPPPADRRIVRNHVAYTAPIAIDARLKPGFPKELICDDATAQMVTRRWNEYFPSRNVEMGDSNRANLD